MRMRELTRLTGITSADLTNWRSRGMTGIPPSQQGQERKFGSDDKMLVIVLGLLKALALHGLALERAKAFAVGWVNFYGANPSHDSVIVVNLRTMETNVRDFNDGMSLREAFDAFPDETVEDPDDLSAAGTSLAVVDAWQIAQRIERAFKAEGDLA
ncbi:MAG: hypothetical protein AcusKO_14660 [Acuticoccus sp.]